MRFVMCVLFTLLLVPRTAEAAPIVFKMMVQANATDFTSGGDPTDSQVLTSSTATNLGPASAEAGTGSAWASITGVALGDLRSFTHSPQPVIWLRHSGTHEIFDTLTLESSTLLAGTPVTLIPTFDSRGRSHLTVFPLRAVLAPSPMQGCKAPTA